MFIHSLTYFYLVFLYLSIQSTYDLHGEEGLKKEKEASNFGGGGIFDLFRGPQAAGKRKGPDYRMDYKVTLEDLYKGMKTQLRVSRKVICKHCKGSGAKGGKTTKCSQW
jgi:DnaJ-related protein SCJ1